MGCSSSREALGGVVPPGPAPAERRQSLRSRSLTALTSLGMCRGRSDDVHAYTRLPSEEAPVKGSAIVPTAAAEEVAAVEEEAEHDAPATSEVVSGGAVKGAAPSPPSPVHAAAPDLDAAILPGLRQIVMGSSPSHPALLYPEHDRPVLPPPETTVAVEACDVVDMGTPAARDIPEVTGIVRARVGQLHEQMEKKKKRDKAADVAVEDADCVTTPKKQQPATALDVNVTVTPRSRAARAAGKPAVVLYFTSLRGVRRTFEDGRAVRAILRCHRVRLDERDVSMHAAFRSELRDLLGAGFEGPALPRVFVGGVDLGGADDVRALHEAGELARALAGCDEAARLAGACAACGDARFAPCETCHGSCKVFVDDEGCRFAGFFRRCPDCNENGLIRCPVCCY